MQVYQVKENQAGREFSILSLGPFTKPAGSPGRFSFSASILSTPCPARLHIDLNGAQPPLDANLLDPSEIGGVQFASARSRARLRSATSCGALSGIPKSCRANGVGMDTAGQMDVGRRVVSILDRTSAWSCAGTPTRRAIRYSPTLLTVARFEQEVTAEGRTRCLQRFGTQGKTHLRIHEGPACRPEPVASLNFLGLNGHTRECQRLERGGMATSCFEEEIPAWSDPLELYGPRLCELKLAGCDLDLERNTMQELVGKYGALWVWCNRDRLASVAKALRNYPGRP